MNKTGKSNFSISAGRICWININSYCGPAVKMDAKSADMQHETVFDENGLPIVYGNSHHAVGWY